MFYNLKNDLDKKKAIVKFDSLLKNGSVIELTEKKSRSLNLNSYMHVCFGIVAIEYGLTIEDVKQHLFKGVVNKNYYYLGLDIVFGQNVVKYKSTAQTTNAELSGHLDKFRNYCAAELGLYIPEPHEREIILQAQKEINNYNTYNL